MKKNISLITIGFLLTLLCAQAQEKEPKVEFRFSGYAKTDFIYTMYNNGLVDVNNPLRDIHLPSAIPVGIEDVNHTLDFHAKESRFNFDLRSKLFNKDIHGMVELDFLFSAQGDPRVSNSFSPRLRHFFFEWDKFLIGQTWSTFMIVTLPDEVDFTGAMDGIVLSRQAQFRVTLNDWQFALENPQTTFYNTGESNLSTAGIDIMPDLVVRRNFNGKKINWSIAVIGRALHVGDSTKQTNPGVGITTGGKILLGKRGDDIRLVVTAGQGLGRYLSANFIASAFLDANNQLQTIGSLNGYIAYNHFWTKDGKISSSFSLSGFQAQYGEGATNGSNQTAVSLSGNVKYSPIQKLTLGFEYMYAYRGVVGDINGSMHRIQLAAKYSFGYHNSVVNEKK